MSVGRWVGAVSLPSSEPTELRLLSLWSASDSWLQEGDVKATHDPVRMQKVQRGKDAFAVHQGVPFPHPSAPLKPDEHWHGFSFRDPFSIFVPLIVQLFCP